MTSRLKNDSSNPPGRSILLKILKLWKKVNQEATKFGGHSLSGFKVATANMVVWDKNPPPPVRNRVKIKIILKPGIHCKRKLWDWLKAKGFGTHPSPTVAAPGF